jgi:DNA-binding Lrp family transcriptional regulator
MPFSGLSKNELLVLKELLKNARITDSELADKTGLSRSTATKSRKSIEEKNIFDAYIPFPRLDNTITVFTAYRWTNFSDHDAKQKFEAYIISRKDVLTYMKGSGFKGSSHLIISNHKNIEEYEQMMGDVREHLKTDGEILDMFFTSEEMQLKRLSEYLAEIDPK